MLDLELSTDPNAVTVEELAVACLAIAASAPTDSAELAIETIEAWRKIWPACEAVAAQHGVTMCQPIGAEAAQRILAEAAPYLQAELAVTR